ncbi:SchA/CurD-like domain-containing protein [Amycolatopsis sp. NPDC021455]|uniref:SchA/CurD-like domain-containing protein n=1 Tax=Amycolatopsis sp. NPDC021455 TaxID=3154901 RepID=UPI0034060226
MTGPPRVLGWFAAYGAGLLGIPEPRFQPQEHDEEDKTMSQQWALTWNVREGTEAEVIRLFERSGRPDHVVRDDEGNVVGLLKRTSVFMRRNTVVRVIEFDGEFLDVAKHMGRQREVRDLERQLDPYLEQERDMSTPEKTAAFFASASMRCVLSRRHDEELSDA